MTKSVLKFGGSSVSDFNKIKNIALSLKSRVENGEQLVVVVSAMGNTTNELINSINSLTKQPKDEHLALLLTTGEQQTISYLSIILNDLGVNTKAMTGYQAGIQTVGHHLKSKIANIDSKLFEKAFLNHDILVVAGFQGINEDLEITTLGRGGSDTTAVAIAASINSSCEIYTDVDGVYGTDPRIYDKAKLLSTVSYEEMMEMSSLGAGVLETRSVEIAKNYKIPLYLGRTLSNVKGTWIMSRTEILEKKAVTGVALDKHILHVTITYPMRNFELLQDLFDSLEHEEINVDMISQIENQTGLQLSFTTKDTEIYQIENIISKLTNNYPYLRYNMKENFAKLSIIGTGMRDMSGIASQAFRILIQNGINFYQTTTSEISISYVIDKEISEHAVRQMSKAFNI